MLILSFTLFLYSFGYGGITSFTALYADANGVTPKGIYLTTLALVILVTRPMSGRLGDRFGYRRVLPAVPGADRRRAGVPASSAGRAFWLMASAVIFGIGFGTAYPVFAGYVMRHVGPERRGAAFGAILACFDTGIGTGSTEHGLDHRPLRLRERVRDRRGAVRARAAVFPGRRPPAAGGAAGSDATETCSATDRTDHRRATDLTDTRIKTN